MDAPLRSPKAGGTPIAQRKLLKITFVRYLDETDNAADPQLFEAGAVEETPVTVEPETVETPEQESVTASADEVKVESAPEVAKPKKQSKKSGTAAAPEPEVSADEEAKPEEEEETWGIQPDLGF
ncbi:MAG: hypothetical protein IKZ33_00840 [Lentisphaeria bacterium]|nr:hypothetical protein [Lentisphaeria bacterium]